MVVDLDTIRAVKDLNRELSKIGRTLAELNATLKKISESKDETS